MIPITRLAACLALVSALPSWGETLSTLSVPVMVPLDAVRAAAEDALPNPLFADTGKQTCIPAERMCTDIPEFRGLKIYRRRECIDVTPRIDCTIDQVVSRESELEIVGDGGTLHISQVLRGQITVSGRGDIGRRIRETASGVARLHLSVAPRITADWRIEADIGHAIHWIEPPAARLFNVIEVTFQTRANEELNRAIAAYRRDKLQRDLDRIALRDRIAPLWADLQTPIAVPLPQGDPLYLHFRPQGVALAPFAIDQQGISTRMAVTGRFGLTDSATPESAPLPLPDLSPAPAPAGVDLSLPVVLELETLAGLANAALPRRLVFFKPVRSTIDIRAVSFDEAPGGMLRSRLDATVTLPFLPPFDLPLTLTGRLDWNAGTRTLSLRDPHLDFSAEGLAGQALAYIGATPAALGRLVGVARLPLGDEIDRLEGSLIPALDKALGTNLGADAALRLSVGDLRIDQGLRLTIRAQGALSLTLRALN